MQTMYPAKVNSPTTQLASSITATQTSIPVQDVSVLPAAPNLATIGRDVDAETILYTGVDTVNNTITGVTRGFQGTARAWSAGEQIGRFYTAYDHDTFIANIQAATTGDVAEGAKIYGRVGWWEPIGLTAGTVLSSFVVPPTDFRAGNSALRGLTWDGTRLWCIEWTGEALCRYTPTGAYAGSWGTPANGPAGLTWDGTHLWLSDWDVDRIYRLTTATTVVSWFNSPGIVPLGLAWDGTYLWHVDGRREGRIYQLTTTGTVVSQFNSPSVDPTGLTWDGTHLWNADDNTRIYRLTTTGTVVSSFVSPGTQPWGLAWDGTHLWHANLNKIYRIVPTDRLGLVS